MHVISLTEAKHTPPRARRKLLWWRAMTNTKARRFENEDPVATQLNTASADPDRA
jgi:hypothetical protein